jgi:hypothetical protein
MFPKAVFWSYCDGKTTVVKIILASWKNLLGILGGERLGTTLPSFEARGQVSRIHHQHTRHLVPRGQEQIDLPFHEKMSV